MREIGCCPLGVYTQSLPSSRHWKNQTNKQTNKQTPISPFFLSLSLSFSLLSAVRDSDALEDVAWDLASSLCTRGARTCTSLAGDFLLSRPLGGGGAISFLAGEGSFFTGGTSLAGASTFSLTGSFTLGDGGAYKQIGSQVSIKVSYRF